MKKALALVIIFVLLFNIAGYFVWFVVQKQKNYKDINKEIRSRVRFNLNKDKLALIIVSEADKDDLLWTEFGKEFEYEGTMYDVVKSEVKDGKIYFYCINDVKEMQLKANFLKIHKVGKRASKIKKIPQITYFLFDQSGKQFKISHNYNYFFLQKKYVSNIIDIISPPPEYL